MQDVENAVRKLRRNSELKMWIGAGIVFAGLLEFIFVHWFDQAHTIFLNPLKGLIFDGYWLVGLGLVVGVGIAYVIKHSRASKSQPFSEKMASLLQAMSSHHRGEPPRLEDHTLLRTLIDNLPDYIFIKDTESRYVINNLAHIKILGATSQAELVGKTDFDVFPHDLAQQYYTTEQGVIASGQPVQDQEEVTIDPQGKLQWLLTTKVPLRNPQGEIVGLVGISHDITERKQGDEKLRQLAKSMETMQLGVTITDLDGKILYTNPAEAAMHGYDVEDLIGNNITVFTPSEDSSMSPLRQFDDSKYLREGLNIRKDGSTFPVRLMSDMVKDAAGEPIAIVTTCEDITEYKQTTEKLRQHTRELGLLNHMHDDLQACDAEEQTYPIVIETCKQMFPLDAGCLCITAHPQGAMKVAGFWGEPPLSDDAMSPASAPSCETASTFQPSLLCPHRVYCPHHECLSVPMINGGEILGLLSLCFKHEPAQDSGDHLPPEREAKRLMLDRIVEYYALALANLRLRAKLRTEAIRDPLTSLYNRRYMSETLEREARRAKRQHTSVGIIMLDIDHFKRFNDTYGHKVGDFVLQQLGTYLLTHIRREDIACRYGGEEFVLILPDASLAAATQRAEELRRSLKEHWITYQGSSFHLTISLGVAAFSEHGSDILDTLYLSDKALYQAKTRGRDQVVAYSPDE
ncbi:diguanylate cyclase [candidate division KSB3 bacterium]|uniref:Diguanylate cyclase n=1 Tax=candidate division KSB3 bacterium TaxID=2044937 RepID=A0A9D5Q778_9BACT|nr:diguanylate cyclase [candidate division KSB3 bacterium]MBD3326158.1 diguanylate cyclase [candidate division KSB3 bacterium]